MFGWCRAARRVLDLSLITSIAFAASNPSPFPRLGNAAVERLRPSPRHRAGLVFLAARSRSILQACATSLSTILASMLSVPNPALGRTHGEAFPLRVAFRRAPLSSNVRAMATVPMHPHRWLLALFCVLLLLPALPALLVMLLGFAFPGVIPWSIVEISLPVFSIVSIIICAFLLWRGPGPLALRAFAGVIVAVALSELARTEVVMQAECGPPRGEYIDFQRQNQGPTIHGVTCE